MMTKKSRNTIVYLLFVVAAFAASVRYYYMEDYQSMDTVEAHVNGDMIIFSEDSGFYDETITVSLNKNIEIPSAASIYYTLNGDDPTVERLKYTGAIHLEKNSDFVVYPLKAVVYYDGEYSEIYEKTYVLCDDIHNEFDVEVVSITSDRNNLYDYKTGILTKGKTYYDNLAKYGNISYIEGNYSNRGEEWVRNAHMAIFDRDGRVSLEQNIGLGVSGGSSSAFDVKSLKVYAGYAYDKKYDDFYMDINSEEIQNFQYSFVNKYNSFRLRSGSQDIDFGNIRSSVASRLAQLSGADCATATKRCIVCLNGKFYGIFDMQQNYSNSYLANRFDLADSECIEKYKGSETKTYSEAGISEYFQRDLNDIKNRKLLEKYVDMDNFLLYYAINILCNNTDWPGNNFEIWRYTGDFEQNNLYSDNRYRFLIYDTDLMFNTESTPPFFAGCQADTFVALMENRYQASGSMFSNVINSAYYRNKFIMIVTDLLNTSFSKENVLKIIYEENEKISAIRKKFYSKEEVEAAEQYVTEMMQEVQNRSEEMENSFAYYFGLVEKYGLEIKTSEGIAVVWNHMSIFGDDIYRSQCYKGVEWTMNQDAYPGYTFQYWQVNGQKVYTPSLVIKDSMIQEGKIDILAVAEKNDTCEIIVSEISAKGTSDWIRISNVGGEPAYLNQYYISDDDKNIRKFQLPDMMLEAGGSVVIYGSKNHESIGEYICNFSLNKDEVLYLSNEEEILFYLPVPKMSDMETYGRYDNSNTWKFYSQQG